MALITPVETLVLLEIARRKREREREIEAEIPAPAPAIRMEHIILMLGGAVIVKLMKTESGRRDLASVAREGLKAGGNILSSLMQASATNRIMAWAGPSLLAFILEKIGLIPSGIAMWFSVGLGVLTGADIATEWAEAVAGAIPFSKGADTDFPTSVNFDVADFTVTYERE